ncbi:YIP1 family protein [Metabacillus litoralis]|uniref:YIP1 family protein n=1 Tax=Metabacillus litoralis TaxID=152268 RepID=A0A5C6W464_9BACI|nr:Yip1 family protein [Metabacillus litoralis]TXC92150.1 YIP1 family protein [Metabacillus litoralis]
MQSETNMEREEIQTKKPSVFGMVFSPVEQFERMKEKPVIWLPLIALSIISMIVTILVTLNLEVDYGSMSGIEMTPDEIAVMETINLVTAILGGLLGTPISYVIFALILYGISRIAKSKVGFKQMFSLVIFVSFISVIGQVINQSIIIAIGGDPVVYLTSLNSFIEAKGALGGILSGIEVFSIWYYILLGIGLVKVANLSKAAAYTITIIFYLIMLIIAAISGVFQGMSPF